MAAEDSKRDVVRSARFTYDEAARLDAFAASLGITPANLLVASLIRNKVIDKREVPENVVASLLDGPEGASVAQALAEEADLDAAEAEEDAAFLAELREA